MKSVFKVGATELDYKNVKPLSYIVFVETVTHINEWKSKDTSNAIRSNGTKMNRKSSRNTIVPINLLFVCAASLVTTLYTETDRESIADIGLPQT